MGRLVYGTKGNSIEMDDRTLAHLRLVVMTKLRRAECFMLDVPLADGRGSHRSVWLHPSVPLVFHFYGNRQPRINRTWAEQMVQAAGGPDGLTIGPEPEESVRLPTFAP